jgi:hypothetical protein
MRIHTDPDYLHLRQCERTWMFSPDPDVNRDLDLFHPGSRIHRRQKIGRGEKKFLFFVTMNFTECAEQKNLAN